MTNAEVQYLFKDYPDYKEYYVELHLAATDDIRAAIRILEEKNKSIRKYGPNFGVNRRMSPGEITVFLSSSKRAQFLSHACSIQQLQAQLQKLGVNHSVSSKSGKKKKRKKELNPYEIAAINAEAAIAKHKNHHNSGKKTDSTNISGQWEPGPDPTCDAWSLVYQRWGGVHR